MSTFTTARHCKPEQMQPNEANRIKMEESDRETGATQNLLFIYQIIALTFQLPIH